MANEMNRYY